MRGRISSGPGKDRDITIDGLACSIHGPQSPGLRGRFRGRRVGMGGDTGSFVRYVSVRWGRPALRGRGDDVDEALTADLGIEQIVGF